MTGPLAAYAAGGAGRRAPVQVYAASRRSLGGCWRDPDAAYDPDDPCNKHTAPASAPVRVAAAEAPVQSTAPGTVLWGASGNAVQAPPSNVYLPQSAAAMPPRRSRFALIESAQAEPVAMSTVDARWGVQVGAFADPAFARQVAEAARHAAAAQLGSAHTTVTRTAPFGGQILYRARLTGITHPAADQACTRLTAHSWSCLTVPPGG